MAQRAAEGQAEGQPHEDGRRDDERGVAAVERDHAEQQGGRRAEVTDDRGPACGERPPNHWLTAAAPAIAATTTPPKTRLWMWVRLAGEAREQRQVDPEDRPRRHHAEDREPEVRADRCRHRGPRDAERRRAAGPVRLGHRQHAEQQREDDGTDEGVRRHERVRPELREQGGAEDRHARCRC